MMTESHDRTVREEENMCNDLGVQCVRESTIKGHKMKTFKDVWYSSVISGMLRNSSEWLLVNSINRLLYKPQRPIDHAVLHQYKLLPVCQSKYRNSCTFLFFVFKPHYALLEVKWADGRPYSKINCVWTWSANTLMHTNEHGMNTFNTLETNSIHTAGHLSCKVQRSDTALFPVT